MLKMSLDNFSPLFVFYLPLIPFFLHETSIGGHITSIRTISSIDGTCFSIKTKTKAIFLVFVILIVKTDQLFFCFGEIECERNYVAICWSLKR